MGSSKLNRAGVLLTAAVPDTGPRQEDRHQPQVRDTRTLTSTRLLSYPSEGGGPDTVRISTRRKPHVALPQGCVSAPACCQIRSEDVWRPCGTCTDGPTQRAADPGQQGEIPHGDSGPGARRGLRPSTPEKLQATCPEEEAQRLRTSSSTADTLHPQHRASPDAWRLEEAAACTGAGATGSAARSGCRHVVCWPRCVKGVGGRNGTTRASWGESQGSEESHALLKTARTTPLGPDGWTKHHSFESPITPTRAVRQAPEAQDNCIDHILLRGTMSPTRNWKPDTSTWFCVPDAGAHSPGNMEGQQG